MTAPAELPLITAGAAVPINDAGVCSKPVWISKPARGGRADEACWVNWCGIPPAAKITERLGGCSTVMDWWGISLGPRDQPSGA